MEYIYPERIYKIMLLTGILVQNSNVMLKVMLMESKYWVCFTRSLNKYIK